MKKLLLTLATVLMTAWGMNAADQTYKGAVTSSMKFTQQASTKVTLTSSDNTGDITTIDWDVAWTSYGSLNGQRDGSNFRYGSQNSATEDLSYSTDAFKGKHVKSVAFECYKNGSKSDYSAKVAYDGKETASQQISATSLTTYTFEVNADVADKLIISWHNAFKETGKNSGNGGLYFHSITVVYSDATGSEGGEGGETEEVKPLGDLVLMDGETTITGNSYEVAAGTSITVSCENAKAFYIMDPEAEEVVLNNGAFTVTKFGEYNIEATNGLEATDPNYEKKEVSITFTEKVQEVVKLGELIIMNGTTRYYNNDKAEVEANTVLNISCENAEKIVASSFISSDKTEITNGTYTITESDTYLFTASKGDESKDIMVTFTVKANQGTETPDAEGDLVETLTIANFTDITSSQYNISSYKSTVTGVTYSVRAGKGENNEMLMNGSAVMALTANSNNLKIKSIKLVKASSANTDRNITIYTKASAFDALTKEGLTTTGATALDEKFSLKNAEFTHAFTDDVYFIALTGSKGNSNLQSIEITYEAVKAPAAPKHEVRDTEIYITAAEGHTIWHKITPKATTPTQSMMKVAANELTAADSQWQQNNSSTPHILSIPRTEDLNNSTIEVVAVDGKNNVSNTLSLDVAADGKVTTGIEDIVADSEDAEAVYYNLQGVRVANPAAGQLLIKVQGKKASKVLFK